MEPGTFSLLLENQWKSIHPRGAAWTNPTDGAALLKSSSTSLCKRWCRVRNPKLGAGSNKYCVLVLTTSLRPWDCLNNTLPDEKQEARSWSFEVLPNKSESSSHYVAAGISASALPAESEHEICYSVIWLCKDPLTCWSGHILHYPCISAHILGYTNNHSLQKFCMKQYYEELYKHCDWTCS